MKRAVLAGFRGHSPKWFRLHGTLIEIVAVSGAWNPRAEEEAGAAGCAPARYEDHYEMIAREDADIALVWTRDPAEHCPVGRAALVRGMDVMLEKPLSNDAREAEAFAAEVARSGRIAMVMQDVRWQNSAAAIKDAIVAGKCGTPYAIDVSLRGRFDGFVYEGIHLVDLTRYWYEREASWVMAAGVTPAHDPRDVDNVVSLTIGYDGGAVAHVTMDWSAQGHQHWIRARVEGDEAAMKIAWGQPVEIQRGSDPVERCPLSKTEDNSMKKLMTHFLSSVDERSEPINRVADHLKTLDIVCAGWESVKTGQPVALPYATGGAR